MNVMMLDPSAYTPYYDFSLCQALAGLGHRVTLVTTPFRYDVLPPASGFATSYRYFRAFDTLRRIPGLAARAPRLALKALEYPVDQASALILARRLRPDVVHVQWSLDPRWDLWFLRRLKARGARLVLTAHDLLPPGHVQPAPPSRVRHFAALYRLADAIVVHTRANRAELVHNFGVAADRVAVIPQGNLADFVRPTLTPAEARARARIPPDVPVALFFGLIKPYKGLDVLLRAFAIARQTLPGAQLMVVGQPREDFARYARLIDTLGLAGAVHRDLRYVPHGEIGDVFAAADLVVLPYLHTYQSAVLFTAYTVGRALIVTRTGGLAETVEGDQTGLAVAAGDVDALARALVALLADRDQCRELGGRAHDLARTRYSWPEIARRTVDVYAGRPFE